MAELKAETIVPQGSAITIQMYGKAEVDEAIAELKYKLGNAIVVAEYVKKLEKELAEFREANRWRKYQEEKPQSDGYYIICGSSGFRNADRFMECKDGRGMDFSFYSYGVEYWMPMPKAPEAKNEP